MQQRNVRNQSLVTRLEFILVAALSFALLVSLVMLTWQEVVSQRWRVQAQSNAWLGALAVQAEAALMFDDDKAAGDILRAASIYPGLQAARVINASGKRLADYPMVSGADDKATQFQSKPAFFSRALVINSPVLAMGRVIGYVQARIDLSVMWLELFKFAATLTLVLGFSGVAAALVARRFLRRAVLPALRLKQVMDEVASHNNYAVRAPVSVNDEIGELAKGFNNMLMQIQERDRLLDVNNARLRALKDEAEHASTSKSEFLAMMSHELRTPMAGVLGMLSLALRSAMPGKLRDQIDTANQNAQSLLAIVNDLLDISKIEAGKIDLEKIDLALRPLLDESMHLLKERAHQKSLHFVLDVDPALPPYLQGDPTRLRQILINLVGNAIKFTERGQITVSVKLLAHAGATAQGDPLRLRFAVADTGIGISEEAIPRLFQKFEQADRSTTRRFGGTGLGLSISKQLVELMGGQVGVTSQLGRGSTFYFELPMAVGQKPLATGAYLRLPHNYRLHVLVAEDATTNQIVIRALVEEMGHTVTLVENGQLALQALSQTDFDVVLMDGRMPVMGGLEATRHIRAGHWRDLVFANRHIPIIALTANASQKDRESFLAAGTNDFLTKPIDETALHQSLLRVIDERLARHLPLVAQASPQSQAMSLEQLDRMLGLDQLEMAPEPLEPPASAEAPAPLRARLLRVFCDQTPQRISDIEHAVARDDWATAAILVHGIKGGSAHIWPDSDLVRQSGALEDMADQRLTADFSAGFSLLKLQLAQCVQDATDELSKTEPAQAAGLPAPAPAPAPAPTVSAQRLDQLTQLLQQRDSRAVDVVQDLAAAFVATDRQKDWATIAAAVERYDFDVALIKLAALRVMLTP